LVLFGLLDVQRFKERAVSIMVGLKAFAIWLIILVLAVLNGALREMMLIPLLGTSVSLVLSGLLLSGLIFVTTYLVLPWLKMQYSRELVIVGLSWVALTIVFEFAFGLSQGQSYQELLAAYTFTDGNIWPVVLVVIALSPWLAVRIRRQI
jgi:hypothetical protein